jgi:hypothetical protein
MQTWLTFLLFMWGALMLSLGVMAVIFIVRKINSRKDEFSNGV